MERKRTSRGNGQRRLVLERIARGERIKQREGGSNRRLRNYILCSGRAAGLESHLAL